MTPLLPPAVTRLLKIDLLHTGVRAERQGELVRFSDDMTSSRLVFLARFI